jgi:hypothetical protein
MPRVGLEPTTPVFERAKTVHALDRAATVIGSIMFYPLHISIITDHRGHRIVTLKWIEFYNTPLPPFHITSAALEKRPAQ